MGGRWWRRWRRCLELKECGWRRRLELVGGVFVPLIGGVGVLVVAEMSPWLSLVVAVVKPLVVEIHGPKVCVLTLRPSGMVALAAFRETVRRAHNLL